MQEKIQGERNVGNVCDVFPLNCHLKEQVTISDDGGTATSGYTFKIKAQKLLGWNETMVWLT